PHALQPDRTPTRFLLVRAEDARELLPDALRAAGGHVTIAPAYRTVTPADSLPALRDLFASPASFPHALTFTSSSSVRNLLALCDAAGLSLPPAPLRISIGPITSQTLRDAGYPPHAEAPEATVAALARTVLQALRDTPSQP
ncbi:MAG TPA: uroporphyrinogen-III synthase, partial [Acidobacteriaceae bacterium]|nr:uroporphyrinogen-III synthase [Acidobacteriaceae bacterium]